MNKQEFYRFIEQGNIQGACRYFEYWYVYNNVPEGSRVLEMGAGKSALAQALKDKAGYVYTTDIEADAVQYQVENGLISELTDNFDSFGDEMFDVVITASAIEHFDPENGGDIKAIMDTWRILKPGGLFIIGGIPAEQEFIVNRYAGKKHPPCIVYNEEEYEKRFLNGFQEIDRQLYTMSNKQPKDYTPKAGWFGISTEPTKKFGPGNGLCAVLRKI